jgi:transcriptional regulator with XRE-family HTH domain
MTKKRKAYEKQNNKKYDKRIECQMMSKMRRLRKTIKAQEVHKDLTAITAAKLEVSVPTLLRFESNLTPPSMLFLFKYAQALDLDFFQIKKEVFAEMFAEGELV